MRMPELKVLLALFLAAGAFWIFVEIADEFVGGRSEAIDKTILAFFQSSLNPRGPVGPRWLAELARDITALGSLGVLAIVITVSVLFLLSAKQRSSAWMVLVATGGGILGTYVLKAVFARPRPPAMSPYTYSYSFSFPSGHALMAAVTYLTLGALIARGFRNFVLKTYVMCVAVLLTVLVGISRIYLGVHWPSDVLGGWSLGAAWALVCWAIAEWLEPQMRSE